MTDARQKAIDAFTDEHGSPPSLLVRAPGRVNLIGEHTDYNGGLVLPFAIDRAVWLAARPRRDGRVRLRSLDADGVADFPADSPGKGGPTWTEYAKGGCDAASRAGIEPGGFEGVLASDLPIGAGLSSSAALLVAVVRAIMEIAGVKWDPAAAARIATRAENDWVGVPSGIMDQTTIAEGRAGHAMFLDCRSGKVEHIPLPPDAQVIVLDTGTRRRLGDSAYADRREGCEAATRMLAVPTLRDAIAESPADLEPPHRGLARHVITENTRVLRAAGALRSGDLEGLGRLLTESHASLRDDFLVSSAELDAFVAAAEARPGCLGARMTGAGFAGSAIALVRTESAPEFIDRVAVEYERGAGRAGKAFPVRASDGATIERPGERGG